MFGRISGIEKVDEEEGGYQDFLSKSFCLTVAKKFVGEPISVSLYLAIDNFLLQRLNHGFLSKNFCLTVPKVFVGDPFSFSLFSGIEKCQG